MKIGIVGAGKIGGLIGALWSRAGHEVMFASRHPESLTDLVVAAGGGATSGTADQAIACGDVILLSIPFKELPSSVQPSTTRSVAKWCSRQATRR